MVDGGEPPLFKQYFATWKEPEQNIGLGRLYTKEQIAGSYYVFCLHAFVFEMTELIRAYFMTRVYCEKLIAASKVPEELFNVNTLHREKRRLLAKNLGKAFGFMPDDGSGKVEVYKNGLYN